MSVHVLNEAQYVRFWAKVSQDGDRDDCWLWLGSKDRNGYGQVRLGPRPGRLFYAHRLSYEMDRGRPIPLGLVIDHLCKAPACVNPGHLEAVTQAENVRRGNGNGFRDKTHCKRGHEFSAANTYANHGGRGCRACKVAYDAARHMAKVAAR